MDDSDADGMATWEEYLAGTNPTNALSRFKADIIEKNGIAYIHWVPDLTNALPARTYAIHGVTNLAEGFTSGPVTNLPAGTPVPLKSLMPNRFLKVRVDLEQH
ncbi:MAG: hypothetical protein PHO37_03315 [Kiritimatiellae bacterium]|nr:hypothetical protein [Kiritimatiellia bacterium]